MQFPNEHAEGSTCATFSTFATLATCNFIAERAHEIPTFWIVKPTIIASPLLPFLHTQNAWGSTSSDSSGTHEVHAVHVCNPGHAVWMGCCHGSAGQRCHSGSRFVHAWDSPGPITEAVKTAQGCFPNLSKVPTVGAHREPQLWVVAPEGKLVLEGKCGSSWSRGACKV